MLSERQRVRCARSALAQFKPIRQLSPDAPRSPKWIRFDVSREFRRYGLRDACAAEIHFDPLPPIRFS